MEITLEKLIAAGNDLNNVLKLEPPINLIFTFAKELKGGAAKAVEAKFMRGLQAEIIQLAEFEDKETGKFDLQPGDLPLLQPETIELIKDLSPITAERFNGSPTNLNKEKKEKAGKKSLPEKKIIKGRIECGVSSILQLGIESAIQNTKEVVQKANQEYAQIGGDSNEKESKWAVGLILKVIKAIQSDGYQIKKG